MEKLNTFLESSTIHGLSYIAAGRKYVRLFWILVVIGGFSAAGFIIYQSFQSWADSPVKTTIETLPITEITFPKVTVCPPKNTYTDLNYDLMMTENMTLDSAIRNELENYAVEMLYDHLYDTIMRNMSKLEDNDRYYNWYHGYTMILLPYIRGGSYMTGVNYDVETSASSGSISTKNFGDKFDADKVETGPLYYKVNLYPSDSVKNNPTVTLHLDVEKVSLRGVASEEEKLSVGGTRVETSHMSFNYSSPLDRYYYIQLDREVLPEDIKKQKLTQMPGFRVRWHYSGNFGMGVEPWAKYYNNAYYPITTAFIRNCSNEIKIMFCYNLFTQ